MTDSCSQSAEGCGMQGLILLVDPPESASPWDCARTVGAVWVQCCGWWTRHAHAVVAGHCSARSGNSDNRLFLGAPGSQDIWGGYTSADSGALTLWSGLEHRDSKFRHHNSAAAHEMYRARRRSCAPEQSCIEWDCTISRPGLNVK